HHHAPATDVEGHAGEGPHRAGPVPAGTCPRPRRADLRRRPGCPPGHHGRDPAQLRRRLAHAHRDAPGPRPRADARRRGRHGPRTRRPRWPDRCPERGARGRTRPHRQGDVPMITTLLSHEWKRTRTAMGLATGTAVAAAVVGSLLAATGWVGVSQTGVILAGAAVFGLVPALQLLLAIDYWRSSHGSGGAFTQTLPIRGRRIFAAKLLHMWLVTLAALVLSVVVLTPLLWWGIATANGSDANVFRVVQ